MTRTTNARIAGVAFLHRDLAMIGLTCRVGVVHAR